MHDLIPVLTAGLLAGFFVGVYAEQWLEKRASKTGIVDAELKLYTYVITQFEETHAFTTRVEGEKFYTDENYVRVMKGANSMFIAPREFVTNAVREDAVK